MEEIETTIDNINEPNKLLVTAVGVAATLGCIYVLSKVPRVYRSVRAGVKAVREENNRHRMESVIDTTESDRKKK